MNRALLLALIVSASPASAQEDLRENKKAGALALLPPGSVIQGLSIPRYSEQGDLESVTKVAQLKVVDEHRLEGIGVDVTFFRGTGQKTTLYLAEADIDREKSLLLSDDALVLKDAAGSIKSSGLALLLQERRLWFRGPCLTTFSRSALDTSSPTSQRTTPTPFFLHASGATIRLITLPITAALPGDISSAEQEQLAEELQKVETSKAPLKSMTQETNQDLTSSQENSQRLRTRLDQLRSLLPNTFSTVADEEVPAAPPTAADIEASCSEGIYLDPSEDALVYVGDVKFRDNTRGLTMTAKEQVKAILTRKVEEKDQDDPGDLLSQFEDVKSVIGTGGIYLTITDQKGQTATARSSTILLDNQKQQAVLTGGTPTVTVGKSSTVVSGPDARIVVNLKGGQPSFTFVGKVEQKLFKEDIQQ